MRGQITRFGMSQNPPSACALGRDRMTARPLTLQRGLASFRRLLPADESGVALVEFALVLPLVLILLLGIIDVGKAVNYWNDETHLANEAARYVAVNKSPDPNWAANPTTANYKVNTAVKNQADTGELRSGGTQSISSPGANICIYFPAGTHNVNDPVKVVVTAQYNWLAYLVGRALPAHSTLTATSTMRIEQAPTDPTNSSSTDAYVASSTNSC
jgi:Flp pilus assembly protein TadG